jgi:signal transduction histidine kinase
MKNIAKHSQATEVSLRFQNHQSNLAINIEDNGRGFEKLAAADAGGGLQNIHQRVEKAGAQFDHQSKPGRGTSCHTLLPFDRVAQSGKAGRRLVGSW